MSLGKTSELGPWNRIQQPQQQTLYNQTKNSNFKQEIILPKVIKTRQYIFKGRKSKQKFFQPLKLKPIQIQMDKNKSDHQNSQIQVSEGRRSQTIQFDIPKITSHGRNFQKFSKSKQKSTFFEDTNKFNEQQNKWSVSPKMSKIDLIAQYLETAQKQQGRQSSKTSKMKEYQYSKKRSLMEMLRYLRFSPQASLSEKPGLIHKLQKSARFDGYLNMVASPRGQYTYLPNFSTKKTNIIGKKK